MNETGSQYLSPGISTSTPSSKKRSPLLEFVKNVWKNGKGKAGALIYIAMIGIAFYGRFFSPYSPTDVQFRAPAFPFPFLQTFLTNSSRGLLFFDEGVEVEIPGERYCDPVSFNPAPPSDQVLHKADQQ